MSAGEFDETRNLWNRLADDWRIQVGDEGDSNRILNSDPVLWKFAGEVNGLAILDAGCGTGYLSKKLCDRGARVTGIDFSERMIEIARSQYPDLDFRVDSCSDLNTLDDECFDLAIANYVLMDTPDLPGTMAALNRVLKTGGVAVLVFSHPCFPQANATVSENGEEISYIWSFPYFESRKFIAPPWAHFTSEFIWFHRSLSDYWKAFMSAGFLILDFEEPRNIQDREQLTENDDNERKSQIRPCSVAFKLQKSHSVSSC